MSGSVNRKIIAAAWAVVAPVAAAAGATPPRPNIIHILADDLGYGDVGPNGQSLIQTPNINALAASGVKFQTAYCSAAECAPSRVALLTGFHTGHTYIDSNLDPNWRAEDITMAETLKVAGYATGVFGKWGFGGSSSGTDSVVDATSLPNNQGFDNFYGYLNHIRAQNYFEPNLWQTNPSAANGVEKIPTGGTYTHDLITQKAVQYITDHAASALPFYLQYDPTIPHFDLDQIASVPNWDSAYQGAQYASWSDKQKKYAAMVTRFDTSVGQILARLNDPNGDGNTSDSIANNTLVIFSSDNGPNFLDDAPYEFFDSNGPFKGGKAELYEGGIRTAMIMRWSGTIAPGTTNGRVIDGADFMPTVAELAGTEAPVGVDGVSFAPLLDGGGGIVKNRDTFAFENYQPIAGIAGPPITRWALRQGDFKLIKYVDDTFALYDLGNDPAETTNLVNALPAMKTQLQAVAIAEGVEQPEGYAVTYRIWSGGNNASVAADANWSGTGTPAENWSAVVQNSTSSQTRNAIVSTNLTFLGFGVRGITGLQKVTVNNGVTLTGRNEIRISFAGEIDVLGGTLRSNRFIDIKASGLLAGFGTIDARIYNASAVAASGGTLNLLQGGTHSGTVYADAGATLNFAGGTHLLTPTATFGGPGTIMLSGSARVEADRTGPARTLTLAGLSIGSAAKLDLTDNRLIATATAVGSWDGSSYTGVTGMVQRGYNGGGWNGAGGIITSETTATASVLTTLAVARAGDIGRAGGTFGGVSVTANDVLVMYTWGGDADLNGELNGDDYFFIDSHVLQSESVFGFNNGDFDYNGQINGDDYFILDSNILQAQASAPFPSGIGAVPEPAGAAAALLLCAFAKRKRPGVNRGV